MNCYLTLWMSAANSKPVEPEENNRMNFWTLNYFQPNVCLRGNSDWGQTCIVIPFAWFDLVSTKTQSTALIFEKQCTNPMLSSKSYDHWSWYLELHFKVHSEKEICSSSVCYRCMIKSNRWMSREPVKERLNLVKAFPPSLENGKFYSCTVT